MSKIDVNALKQHLCLQCLECCRWLRFDCFLGDKSLVNDSVIFYSTRGCKVKVVDHSQGNILCLLVPSICGHLTDSGCDIYGSRPAACRRYSGLDDTMLKDSCKWSELK